MFGLIYAGIVGFCKAVVSIQEGGYDSNSYNNAQHKHKLTYRDHQGLERSTETGTIVWHNRLKNGDRILQSIDGEIIHNFDIETRQNQIKKKQDEINKETDQLVLIGRFEDIYPDKVRKSGTMWHSLNGKEIVYKYLGDEKYYFRSLNRGAGAKWIFTDVETGLLSHLYQDDVTEYNKKWIISQNATINKMNQWYIINTKFMDTI